VVFGPVPRERILAAMRSELRWATQHAPAAYAVLNACRAARYADDGRLVSKLDGGEWYLTRHPRVRPQPQRRDRRRHHRQLRGHRVHAPAETAHGDLVGRRLPRVVPPHAGRRLAELFTPWYEALKAPAKQVVVFDTSGHRPMFEQPDRFVDVMTRVLAETRGQSQ
jgi:pimeloyl-ACP methyl ester carboxylesterase